MPVFLRSISNLLVHASSIPILCVMFSRITICAYFSVIVLYLLNLCIKYYEYYIELLVEANTFFSALAGERPIVTISLSILILISLYIIINLLLIFIKASFIKIRSGKPPVGSLTIAYKFISPATANENIFANTKGLFPSKKFIQLYYVDEKVDALGIAYGAILNEDGVGPDDDTRLMLFKNNFRLFYTPAVNNAVYTVCSRIPWLVPTYWIVICFIYPKLFSYCQKRNLSAYPVIEIFEKDTITFMAPLCRQDDFVVLEAEDLVRNVQGCSAESSFSDSFGETPSASVLSSKI